MTELMTPSQWADCYKMRQEIYGNCSKAIDKELATKAVEALYLNANRSKPSKILFAKSPLAGLALLTQANLWANLRANLGANLWDNLGANLRANLGDNLGANLRANLGANLGANLRDNLRDNLWDNLWDNLRANLWANLGANLRANLWDNLGANLGANLRANLWANLGDNLRDNLRAFYWEKSYLGFLKGGEIAGVKYDQNTWATYKLITENLDVIFPFADFCIVCERPISIGWSEVGIHCEDGPAVEYADGYKLWAIDGYLVPEKVVMDPQAQTVEEIIAEPNEEVKRIRINRFGWSNFAIKTAAKVLDIATPSYGGMESLMLLESNGYSFHVLFTYDPSTGRPYALEVDPNCTTCEEAQRYLLAPEVAFVRHGIQASNIATYPIIRA